MGLLDKILGRSRIASSGREMFPLAAAFIFVFDVLPTVDPQHVVATISSIEPLKRPAKVEVQVQEQGVLRSFIEFADHKLELVAFSEPTPAAVIERTVQPSHWKEEEKAPLRNHKAHIVCFYRGSNPAPTEQIIAMYKTASSFYDKGLLGVLDEDAWNCMPRQAVKVQVSRTMLNLCRKAVPLGVWTGFVKFFKDKDDVWFCTKGHHRFGVNDFAYFGRLREAEEVDRVFGDLFYCVYEKKGVFQVGHTAELGRHWFVRFREIYEYHDSLNTPLGTLVLEKITP